MRKQSVFILAMAVLASCSQGSKTPKQSLEKSLPVEVVNPFIGTGGHGHTFPGAAYPFGQIQLSPDNGTAAWDWTSGYHDSSNTIAGFSHLHLSGTGIGDLYDISFLPVAGLVEYKKGESNTDFIKRYQGTYKKENESAKPGYYSVLMDSNIKAEMTTGERVGMQRYTFPSDKKNTIVLNLGFSINWDKTLETELNVVDKQTVTGVRMSTGWAADQKVYFAAKFNQPIDKPEIVLSGEEQAKVGLFQFNAKQILVQVAISSVSVDNALKNLETNSNDFDFDGMHQKTQTVWNKALNTIKIEALNKDKEQVFYTALYHTMLAPSIFSDVNHQFKGLDGSTQIAEGYDRHTVFSLWDTYRTLHPLLTLINPTKANDMVESLVDQYTQTGMLPVWELEGNDNGCMVGIHGISVVAEAIAKNLGTFDKEKAYEAVRNTAMAKVDFNKLAKSLHGSIDEHYKPLRMHIENGYIPSDKVNEAVAKGLEYCVSDYAVAMAAKSLGKTDDYKYFLNRSMNYKNYFDASVGFMRGKNTDGTWVKNFIPTESKHRGNDYTEGTAWQYLWLVPQDPKGLVDLLGGEKSFAKKMDQYFGLEKGITGENASPDISGLIGGYAHGNEPGHHTIYMYNYAHRYDRAEELLHKVYSEFYTNKVDGLAGNEDCGQMSAWYVMNALGFYPVHTATGEYQIGLPDVKKAEISLENGKQFTVLAPTLSDKNRYVQSVKLNGKKLNRSYITHKEIMSGGTLEFTLGESPNKNLFQ